MFSSMKYYQNAYSKMQQAKPLPLKQEVVMIDMFPL